MMNTDVRHSLSQGDMLLLKHWLLLIAFGVVLSLVWYQNFEISQIDNSETLTFMNMFRDPNLYPDSFLLKQIYQIHLFSLYYIVSGLIGMIVDPYWGLYGCFIFINCLCVCGLFYLAHAITKNITASYLSVFALVLQWQWSHALGGSAPLGVGPFPDQLATGLLLFALAYYLRGRIFVAYFLAGATFNVHASFSVFVLIMLSISLLVERKWRMLIKGSVIATLIVLPLVIYMFSSQLLASSVSPMLKSTWYQLMIVRSSEHLLPLHWAVGKYARFLPYVLLFILALYYSSKEFPHRSRIINRKLLGLSAGIVVMCIVGIVFAEFYPVASIMKLTLFRSTRFFVIISVIATISFVNNLREKSVYHNVVYMLLLAAVISGSIPMLYVMTGVLYFSNTRHMRKDVMVAVAAVCTLVLLYGVYEYDIVTINRYLNIKYFVVVLMAIFVALYISEKRFQWFQYAAVVLMVSITALFSSVYYSLKDQQYYKSAWNLQLWLRNNMERDECFIAPPSAGISSGISERAYYYAYSDVGYPVYAGYLLPEVLKRLSDYVPNISAIHNSIELSDRMNGAYESWGRKEFKALAKKSGCRYIVVGVNEKLDSTKLYGDGYFSVYDSRLF
ncbi:MAG: hypothetical protein JXB42_10075 [Deltaproteobacteria bacterium]|nr:hypothetical protein [Deltaproteobacteria bacterium]